MYKLGPIQLFAQIYIKKINFVVQTCVIAHFVGVFMLNNNIYIFKDMVQNKYIIEKWGNTYP